MKSEFIETFKVQNVLYGVYLMDNKDNDEIENFFLMFHSCFGIREDLDKTWFNWFYNANPAGVCKNYILLDVSKNIYVGAYGFAKIRYVLNGIRKLGGLGINAMILKEYGRRGLFSRLMDIGLEKENYNKDRLAFSFPHWANIGSVKGHYKSGWSDLDRNHFYYKDKTSISIKSIDCVREVSNTAIIDFNLFKKGKMFYFDKTNDWLTWRFTNRPNRKYIILGNYESDNYINGYMVLVFYRSKNNVTRCQIVDYGIKNANILRNLLIKAENIAVKGNADVLDIMLSDHSDDLDVFLNNRFKKSDEFYHLLVFPNHNLSSRKNINALLGDFDAA